MEEAGRPIPVDVLFSGPGRKLPAEHDDIPGDEDPGGNHEHETDTTGARTDAEDHRAAVRARRS